MSEELFEFLGKLDAEADRRANKNSDDNTVFIFVRYIRHRIEAAATMGQYQASIDISDMDESNI